MEEYHDKEEGINEYAALILMHIINPSSQYSTKYMNNFKQLYLWKEIHNQEEVIENNIIIHELLLPAEEPQTLIIHLFLEKN